MITKRFLAKTTLVSLLCLPFTLNAQSSTCDSCAQLNTLNAYAKDIDTNTGSSSNQLAQLIETLTQALFSTLPSFGNTMVTFRNIPDVESHAYADQQALLHSIETVYRGSSSNDATLTDNYKSIFENYLLQQNDSAPSFDSTNASIASLYVDPSVPGAYTEEQRLAAQRYIMLVSGAAMSTAQAPSSSWLKISNDNMDADKKKIRSAVSAYYTFSAIQSAIADNFAYVYGLNTGQKIDSTLEDYNGETISASGLFTYIQTQKIENPDWYMELGSVGVGGLLKEQTILLGSCFLMLSRIEEDLRRILITSSVQTSMTLTTAQSTSQALTKMPDMKSLTSV